jgi:predicted nucleotidyltransferase
LGKSKVVIFGSRVDMNKKGGDIDIYIIPEIKENIFERKIKFLVDLKMKIGDQKTDVIINKDRNAPIEPEVLKRGVQL